jgi:PhnB protein
MPKRPLNPGGNEAKQIERLNQAVETMLSRRDGKAPKVEADMEPLLRIAADLRDLPHASFKARLKSEFGKRKTMSTVAEPVAAVHPTASPRLSFRDAAKAIEFYKQAFGAKETFRFEAGGHVAHAEMTIGDSVIMLAEEWPEGGRFSAETLGASTVQMVIRVEDVDRFAEKAVAGGLTVRRAVQDQFYGHRDVLLSDPFGYTWSVFTVKEEMSVEEMHRRMKRMTQGPEGGQISAGEKGVSPLSHGHAVSGRAGRRRGDRVRKENVRRRGTTPRGWVSGRLPLRSAG